jgi:peptide/nickel transport system ATP-binding protein
MRRDAATDRRAPIVEIRGLKAGFATAEGRTDVLHGVDLSVARGEIHGVIGESGSGKTLTGLSLLRLMPGNAVVEAQALRFDGVDLPSLAGEDFDALRGVRMAMIFQDPVGAFNPAKRIGWHFRAVFDRKAVAGDLAAEGWRQRSVALMKDVGILRAAEAVDLYPHQLSGGMLQRALIALVLALEPDFVVADEPTTNLDKLVERQILELFRDLRARLSAGMIFVTHDMAVAAALCDRISVMYRGRIVETGETRRIFEAPEHPYTALLTSTALALARGTDERLPEMPGQDTAPAPPGRRPAGEPRVGDGGPLISIRNLEVSFPGRAGVPFRVLKGISLDIQAGEILGVVGESGSGKTTLGKTVLRLWEPSGGDVLFRGTSIAHLGPRGLAPFRRDLQMVFQDPGASFNPRKTVGAALADPLVTHKLASRRELGARIAGLLTRVGLTEAHAERFPHELSGGQLQRVAIARALALDPALIVADEAVSKLDVSVRSGILNLFKDIQAETGMSMLFITHDLEVARYLCHRIAVMYHGELVEIGPAAEVFANPRHDYTRTLIGMLEHGLIGQGLGGMEQASTPA